MIAFAREADADHGDPRRIVMWRAVARILPAFDARDGKDRHRFGLDALAVASDESDPGDDPLSDHHPP